MQKSADVHDRSSIQAGTRAATHPHPLKAAKVRLDGRASRLSSVTLAGVFLPDAPQRGSSYPLQAAAAWSRRAGSAHARHAEQQ
ncbi:hypothetical protein ACRAWD_01080 [Caulobacter segnis]